MKEFITQMLGAGSTSEFMHAFTWAMVGAVISLLLNVANRDANSAHSPVRFSWYFMLRDNLNRLILAVLLIIVTIRFAPEMVGVQLSGFTALLIGFAHDKLAQLLKNKRDAFFNSKTPTKTTMSNIAFPTIDVYNDVITGTSNFGTFSAPILASDLPAADSRFNVQSDEDGTPILCSTIASTEPMPDIEGQGFTPQPAEGFIGPRPPRYRPR